MLMTDGDMMADHMFVAQADGAMADHPLMNVPANIMRHMVALMPDSGRSGMACKHRGEQGESRSEQGFHTNPAVFLTPAVDCLISSIRTCQIAMCGG